jgi:protein-tyrosine kinase
MDRIQSAIQKARAARGKDDPRVSASLAEAWETLEEIRPDARLVDQNRLVSFAGGGQAIAFDMMRTKVLQQMRANKWKRLAITSPEMGSGKTMTCLNLAFSLGRQQDIRTMLIEADLRRPSLAQKLGLRQRHLFSSVLEGEAKAANNLVRFGTNLAFGTNHMPAHNSAELLYSEKVTKALAEVEKTYAPEVMIFDMPPMRAGDDTMAFMGQVDCVLLVAAAGKTTVAQVDACERDLAAQTNVMGVILNKCQYLDPTHSYDYNYHA